MSIWQFLVLAALLAILNVQDAWNGYKAREIGEDIVINVSLGISDIESKLQDLETAVDQE